MPDQFINGAYRWTAPGSVSINGKAAVGNWELVINPSNNTVYHYNFTSR